MLNQRFAEFTPDIAVALALEQATAVVPDTINLASDRVSYVLNEARKRAEERYNARFNTLLNYIFNREIGLTSDTGFKTPVEDRYGILWVQPTTLPREEQFYNVFRMIFNLPETEPTTHEEIMVSRDYFVDIDTGEIAAFEDMLHYGIDDQGNRTSALQIYDRSGPALHMEEKWSSVHVGAAYEGDALNHALFSRNPELLSALFTDLAKFPDVTRLENVVRRQPVLYNEP